MLIIHRVESYVTNGSGHNEPFYMLAHVDGEPISMLICLLDTATSKETVFTFSQDSEGLKLLRHYRPYGFSDLEYNGDEFSYAIVIDEHALQFLDYVESVKAVRIDCFEHPELEKIAHADFCCSALDSHNTLFSGELFEAACICNLLDLVLYYEEGLVGDTIYIPCDYDLNDGMRYRSAYQVTFTDADAAKRFLTKVRVFRKTKVTDQIFI